MSSTPRSGVGTWAVLACASVLTAACADDLPSQDTGETSSSTTDGTTGATSPTGPSVTTTGPSDGSGTTTAAGSTSTDEGTTSASSSGGSTADPPDTSTSSGGTTDASSSSGEEVGTTASGMEGYADCFNNPEVDVCIAGETCVTDGGMPPGVGVCAFQDCAGAGMCPSAPPGGTAPPACMDVTGDMIDECVLDCSAGDSCPTGMACFASFVCVWGGGLGPGDFGCADDDLGFATGPAVAMGSTAGAGDDFNPGCVGPQSQDVQLSWTALVGGTYTFDTVGSSYDTILYVLEDCVGMELACNDDTMMLLSEVSVDLVAGQTVLVVIDGYGGATGNYVLNIN